MKFEKLPTTLNLVHLYTDTMTSNSEKLCSNITLAACSVTWYMQHDTEHYQLITKLAKRITACLKTLFYSSIGCTIGVSIYGIHMNDTVWENPYV